MNSRFLERVERAQAFISPCCRLFLLYSQQTGAKKYKKRKKKRMKVSLINMHASKSWNRWGKWRDIRVKDWRRKCYRPQTNEDTQRKPLSLQARRKTSKPNFNQQHFSLSKNNSQCSETNCFNFSLSFFFYVFGWRKSRRNVLCDFLRALEKLVHFTSAKYEHFSCFQRSDIENEEQLQLLQFKINFSNYWNFTTFAYFFPISFLSWFRTQYSKQFGCHCDVFVASLWLANWT